MSIQTETEIRYAFEPLTYYRNDAEKRGFLLIFCPQKPHEPQVCYLCEFGKSQRQMVEM